ncbi:hypothetical protein [Parvicella tangerina]|uniref:Uncharacterized protein n=1 Tax=Parvicella tangerina TaxID=2829795 RepID=A0A916NBC7_9FLAO|nr:hypothetical protein [Parvicella tangerina]CAG5080619.1 hypothetical protein CRYO30217_01397 [Parvicella tangerina]
MAKYKSLFRINGKLGDIKFEKGKVAMIGDKFEKRKPTKRVLENQQEFAGMSISSTAVLRALSKAKETFADRNTRNRLFSIMREILNLGSGSRGQRVIDLVTHKSKLLGFELNGDDKLESMLHVPITATVNADRNEITVDIPDFSTITDLSAPEFATHLQFKLAIGVIANHGFDANLKKYQSINDSKESLNAMVTSSQLTLGGMIGQTTTLTAQLPTLPVLDGDEVIIGALGIEFLEFINGQYYAFDTDRAMQIIIAE